MSCSAAVCMRERTSLQYSCGTGCCVKKRGKRAADIARANQIPEMMIHTTLGRSSNLYTLLGVQKTRPERDPQQKAQCIYRIPCECGRSYIGETGRPLAVLLGEHRHNL
jgi:hypothetical protein